MARRPDTQPAEDADDAPPGVEVTAAGVAWTDFAAARRYEGEAFTAREVFRTDRLKVVLAYFAPGEFIPVHAPGSDVLVSVQRGAGSVHAAGQRRDVVPRDVVVVPAGESRGVRADAGVRLEALLAVAPPPSDADHEPVREGLARGEFDPRSDAA